MFWHNFSWKCVKDLFLFPVFCWKWYGTLKANSKHENNIIVSHNNGLDSIKQEIWISYCVCETPVDFNEWSDGAVATKLGGHENVWWTVCF